MKCNKCGEIEYSLINGYDVAERLLEDVLFEVRIINNKIIVVKVREEDRDYFEQFNTKKWLLEIKNLVKDMDFLSCPKCNGDIENPFKLKRQIEPKSLGKLTTITDLLKDIQK